jgi:hypothetical protein
VCDRRKPEVGRSARIDEVGYIPFEPEAANLLFQLVSARYERVRLHRYGIDAHAGRNTARLALAAELHASVLADRTGISISTAERWSQWAKRDWAAYVGQRAADNAGGVDSRKPAKQTLQTC